MQKEIQCRPKITFFLMICGAGSSVLYKSVSDYINSIIEGTSHSYTLLFFNIVMIILVIYGLWWSIRIVITINKEGVRLAGMEFVLWSDIKKLDIIPFNESIVIGVITYDPEKTEKMKSRVFKAFEYTPGLPKRDFHISLEKGINKKPEEVLNVIKLYKEIEGSD